MKRKIFLVSVLIFTIIIICVLFVLNNIVATNNSIRHFEKIKYFLNYDYQSGNQKNNFKTESSSQNEKLDYFFGDSIFKYDSYKIDNNNQLFYNGDLPKVFKTKTINQDLKIWKNDLQSKELILFKQKNTVIQNLKIIIEPIELNGPKLHANFVLPIKATNKIDDTSIYTGKYYSFDEIAPDNFSLKKMNFNLQPVLIFVQTNDEKPGIYQYKIKIFFTDEFGIENNFSFLQKVNLLNFDIKKTSGYGTGGITDFGYDNTMFFPHNSQKWLLPTSKKQIFLRSLEPLKVEGGDVQWNKWDFDKEQNNQDFLKKENQKYFINFLKKLNDDLNMSCGYMPDLGINYLKYFVVNSEEHPNDLTEIPIFSGEKGKLINILTNKNLQLKITFQVFDDYINFLIKSGYKKIHIPISIRQADTFPILYISKNYPFDFKKQDNNPLPSLLLKKREQFIDEDGNLTFDGINFYQVVVSYVVKQLSEHIQTKYNNNEFLLQNNEKFKFFFSFDETKYEVNNFIWNIIENNDYHHIFGSHLYLAWQFQVNINDEADIQQKVIDSYDEITIEQRDFLRYEKNINQKVVQERKQQGKLTSYYSSWKDYPASFLGSNLAESFWGPMIAYKMGSNGFGRWYLEGFKNNITLDQEDTTSSSEPGNSYQIYPGDIDGPYYSLRLINYIESIKNVWKLKFISSNYNSDLVNMILKPISLVTNGNQNTNYKWDLDFWNWDKVLKYIETNQKKLSISEQAELVKIFLYYFPFY